MAGTTDVWLNVSTGTGHAETVLTHAFTVSDRMLAGGPRVATDILRAAFKRTFKWFHQEYTPLRFTGYAMSNLDYRVTASTWRKKRARARDNNPDAMRPNVFTDETRKRLVGGGGSRVQANAVGGATSMVVQGRLLHSKVPQGRNLVTMRCLNMVTPQEAKRIAAMFQSFVEVAVNSMTVETFTTRKGETKTRATMAQADHIQAVRSMRGRGNAFEVVVRSSNSGQAATEA